MKKERPFLASQNKAVVPNLTNRRTCLNVQIRWRCNIVVVPPKLPPVPLVDSGLAMENDVVKRSILKKPFLFKDKDLPFVLHTLKSSKMTNVINLPCQKKDEYEEHVKFNSADR